MNIYLVGGAVRDQLLKLPIEERDWVVVGANPQDMLDLNYRPVGKDFPVFLHPETHEEYALARTERKTAPGYKGFHFYAAPEVTLEQDLQRRDLTINAMAQTTDGEIIDPYGGQQDLQARVLRHVSPAFSEDPVRILRVARFAARFSDFHVHPDTLQLMRDMVQNGEVNALVAERVWQEWEKALKEAYPWRFFEVLADCGALKTLFPEFLENSKGITALHQAVKRGLNSIIRFAVLCYGLDLSALEALMQRYRIPKPYSDLALCVWGNYAGYAKVGSLSAGAVLEILEKIDAFRRPERLDLFLSACEAINDEAENSAKSQLLRNVYNTAKIVDIKDLVAQNIKGEDIGKILHQRRTTAIQKLL